MGTGIGDANNAQTIASLQQEIKSLQAQVGQLNQMLVKLIDAQPKLTHLEPSQTPDTPIYNRTCQQVPPDQVKPRMTNSDAKPVELARGDTVAPGSGTVFEEQEGVKAEGADRDKVMSPVSNLYDRKVSEMGAKRYIPKTSQANSARNKRIADRKTIIPVNYVKRALRGDSRTLHQPQFVKLLASDPAIRQNPDILGKFDPGTNFYKDLDSGKRYDSFVERGIKLEKLKVLVPQAEEAKKFESSNSDLVKFLNNPGDKYEKLWGSKTLKFPVRDDNGKVSYETLKLKEEVRKGKSLEQIVDYIVTKSTPVTECFEDKAAQIEKEAIIQDLNVNKSKYKQDIKDARENRLNELLERDEYADVFTRNESVITKPSPPTEKNMDGVYKKLKKAFDEQEKKISSLSWKRRGLAFDRATTIRPKKRAAIREQWTACKKEIAAAEEVRLQLKKDMFKMQFARNEVAEINVAADEMLDDL